MWRIEYDRGTVVVGACGKGRKGRKGEKGGKGEKGSPKVEPDPNERIRSALSATPALTAHAVAPTDSRKAETRRALQLAVVGKSSVRCTRRCPSRPVR